MNRKKTANFVVNKPIHGIRAGAVMKVEVDANGTPVDRIWRRRLRDSAIDQCITRQESKKAPQKPASDQKEA